MEKKPFHEAVAEKLIEQLQQGTAPWQRPWQAGDPNGMLPYNPSTGKRYRGINSIVLMMSGHADQRWLTYRQASELDAQVRKGEKGTQIQYWKFTDERPVLDASGRPVKDANGETKIQTVELERPRMFTATVFNAEQIDGLPAIERKAVTWNASERAENILAASGATIKHNINSGAYYRPSTDAMHMPEKGAFATADAYYATALHELGHWTGHPARLDRDLSHPFGSEGYAKEELRAEIASMVLGDELGIGHDPGQHAAYVGSWIKVLRDDPMEIFRAAADAEKIQTYVLALETQQQLEQEPTNAVVLEPAVVKRLTNDIAHAVESTETAWSNAASLGRQAAVNIGNGRYDAALEQLQTAGTLTDPYGPPTPYTDAAVELKSAIALLDWREGQTTRREALDPDVIARLQDDIAYAVEVSEETWSRAAVLGREAITALNQGRYDDATKALEGATTLTDDFGPPAPFKEALANLQAALAPAQQVQGRTDMPKEPITPNAAISATDTNSDVEQLKALLPAYEELAAARKATDDRYYAEENKLVDIGTSDLSDDQKREAVTAQRLVVDEAQAQAFEASNAIETFAQKNPAIAGYHVLKTHEQLHGNEIPTDAVEAGMYQALLTMAYNDAGVTPEQAAAAETVLHAGARNEPHTAHADLADAQAQGVMTALEAAGWSRNNGTAIASKTFDTLNIQKDAAAYLTQGDGFNRTLSFEFTSEGRNVTSADAALIPVGATAAQAAQLAGQAAAKAEQSIRASYGVRLADAADNDVQLGKLDQAVIDSVNDPAAFAEATQARKAYVEAKEPSVEAPTNTTGRVNLAVPYKEKNEASKLGARWDQTNKVWYAPEGADLARLERWLPQQQDSKQPPAMSPREEFTKAMTDLGLTTGQQKGEKGMVLDHPVMDGQRHRVPVADGKPGNLDGFYVGHLDGHPAGFIMNNKTGNEQNWKAKGYRLSDEERAALAADAATKLQAREKQTDAQTERAAERVAAQMKDLAPITEPTPYLKAKGIEAAPGIYTNKDHKTTFVPIVDTIGKQWSMQYIQEDGTKRYAKEGKKEGCFHPVGGMDALAKAPAIVIGEGYATAKTASDAVGFATAAAFDSGNLVAVAKALKEAYPDKPIVIVGDDDKAQELKNGKNPGREKALEAAKAVDGIAVFPVFAPGEQANAPQQFSDFNDLAVRSSLGAEAVTRQLRPAIETAIEKNTNSQRQAQGTTQDAPDQSARVKRGVKA